MPSPSVQAFERKIKKFQTLANTDLRTQMVVETAKIYQTTIRGSINAVTNGGRLRNVGRNGARVGVRRTLLSNDAALIQATGPLQLIERDTQAHDIPRTRGSRRLRTAAGRLSQKRESTGSVLSGRKILRINGSFVTGPVHHPGTTGKHPFDIGVRAAEPAARIAADVLFARALRNVFNG